MNSKEIINKIKEQNGITGRFPTRVILINSWNDYKTIINDLYSICDMSINLVTFTNDDLLPDFRALHNELNKHKNRMILLLSIDEYLRICSKYENDKSRREFVSIWSKMLTTAETTKYIIPIYNGKELFNDAIVDNDHIYRHPEFVYELSDTESDIKPTFNITIFSPDFKDNIVYDATSFKEWLQNYNKLYDDKIDKHFSLRTKLYVFSENMIGKVNVSIEKSPFEYIKKKVSDGHLLKEEFGNKDIWCEVVKSIKINKPFSTTIGFILNVGHKYDILSILSRFNLLTETEKQILWIRNLLYPSHDYISTIMSNAVSIEDMPSLIRDCIFGSETLTSEQMIERKEALKCLNMNYDFEYFQKLDNIYHAKQRLVYITYITKEERIYAIKTISECLQNGENNIELANLIREDYPQFAEYLHPIGWIASQTHKDSNIDEYFNWYRKTKIKNYVPDIVPSIDYDHFDYRNKLIKNCEKSHILWIDGLGAEWMPLLVSEIKKRTGASITPYYAKSVLPSETEFNRHWEKSDDKKDRLDKLSHRGIPDEKDYFSIIAEQIKIICEFSDDVGELIKSNNSVIITGDHGSSRLAALMFHKKDNFALTPPKNSSVFAFGRYCKLTDVAEATVTDSMKLVSITKEDESSVKYLVMKNYEHFTFSGNAIVEIHGGATPEECLIPVIIVSRKNPILKNENQNQSKSTKPVLATVKDMGI